jgi:hypothetical protein
MEIHVHSAGVWVVYNTWNHWACGLPSGILNYLRTQRFGNWMFPSSGERRETPTVLGPLERANLIHWIQENMCLPPLT